MTHFGYVLDDWEDLHWLRRAKLMAHYFHRNNRQRYEMRDKEKEKQDASNPVSVMRKRFFS